MHQIFSDIVRTNGIELGMSFDEAAGEEIIVGVTVLDRRDDEVIPKSTVMKSIEFEVKYGLSLGFNDDGFLIEIVRAESLYGYDFSGSGLPE